ncbi:MAG TPA: hypothetical protein VJM13_04300 [Sphingopyxis sp.]|nr:hypothetical protein [Sphingopyxis sp.]
MMDGDYRPLDYWLLIGMQLAPILFVWLFLRRVYRPSLRNAAFLYTAAVTLVPIIGGLDV